jgi:hypothetical protein
MKKVIVSSFIIVVALMGSAVFAATYTVYNVTSRTFNEVTVNNVVSSVLEQEEKQEMLQSTQDPQSLPSNLASLPSIPLQPGASQIFIVTDSVKEGSIKVDGEAISWASGNENIYSGIGSIFTGDSVNQDSHIFIKQDSAGKLYFDVYGTEIVP